MALDRLSFAMGTGRALLGLGCGLFLAWGGAGCASSTGSLPPEPSAPAKVIPAGEATAPSVDLLAEPMSRPEIDLAVLDPAAVSDGERRRRPEGQAGYVFRWPIEAVSISSPYGNRQNPFRRKRRRAGGSSWHGGLDLN